MFTTRVLYEHFGAKISQSDFFVSMPCACLKSERAMVSSGVIANGRPVFLVMLKCSCFEKNLTFARIGWKILIEVFIEQAPHGACSIVYGNVGIREFRNSKINMKISARGL